MSARIGPQHQPKPYTPQGTINTTDLDSRLIKAHRGWLQGCTAQAVANEQQIVIAAEVSVSAADFGQLEPMLDAAYRELRAAGVHERPRTVPADAGYWHHEQMQRIAAAVMPPQSGSRPPVIVQALTRHRPGLSTVRSGACPALGLSGFSLPASCFAER